ncbi:ulp1 protease family, C-terminal catalytic domain-containing protein [Tanacetum coccineum]
MLQSFLIAAESDRVAKGNIEIFCPCSQCKNFVPYDDIKAIEYHLLKYGFVRNYTCWSEHGESLVDNSTSSHVLNANENNESYINDRHGNLNEMLHDLDANDGDINQEDLQQLFEEAEKPVYDGCDFSVLSAFGVVRWNIPNDDAKKTIRKKANETFRRFKSKLTQQFIVKKNNNPKATYEVVNMTRWDEFVVSHATL